MEYKVILLFLTAVFQKGYLQAPPPEAEQEVTAFLTSNTPSRSSPTPAELDIDAGRVMVAPLSPALKSAQQYLKWIQSDIHSGRQASPREQIRKSRMATFSNPKKLPVDPLERSDLPSLYQIDMDPGIYPRDLQSPTGPAPDQILNPTTQIRPAADSIYNLPGQFPFNTNIKVTGLTLPGTIPGIYPAEPRDPAQFVHPAKTTTIEQPPPSFVKNVQAVKTDQNLHRLQNRQGQNRDMHQQLENKPFKNSRKLLVSRANRRPASATTSKQTQYTGLRMNMLKVPQLDFITNQNAQQEVKQRRRNVPHPESKPDTEVQQLFGSGRDKIISFTRVRKPTQFGNAKPKVTANLREVPKQLQNRSNQIPNTSKPNSQPVRNVNAPKSKQLPNQRSFRFNQSSPKPNVILQRNQQIRPKVTTLPRSENVRPLPLNRIHRDNENGRTSIRLPNHEDLSLLDQINEAKKRTRVLEQFKKQSNLMRGSIGVNQKNGDSLFNRRVQNIQNLATASAQEMKKVLFETQNKPPPKQTLESLVRLRSQQQQKNKPKPNTQQEIGIRIRSQSRHQSQAREMKARQQSQLQSRPSELPVIPVRTKPAPPKVLSLSKSMAVSKLTAPQEPEIITVDNYRSSPVQQTPPTHDDQPPYRPEETSSRDFMEQYRLAEERQTHTPNIKDILNTYQLTSGYPEQFPSNDQVRENQHQRSSTSQQSTQGQNTVQIDESNLDELFKVYGLAAKAPKPPVITDPDPQSDSAVPFSDSQIQYLMGLLNSQKDPSTQDELRDPNSVPPERIPESNHQLFEATRSFDQMQVVKLPNTLNDRAQHQPEAARSTAVSPELVKRLGDGLSSLAGSPVGPIPEYHFVMPPGVATKPRSDFQVDQRSNTPDPTVHSLPAFQDRRNLAQDPVFSFPIPSTYDPQSLTNSLYGQTSQSTLEKQPSGPTSPEINPGASPQGHLAAYMSSQRQQVPPSLSYHNNPFLRGTTSPEIQTPIQSTPQADPIQDSMSASSLSGDHIRIQSPSLISPASATVGLRNQFTAKSSSNDQLQYMVNPGQALRTPVKSMNGGSGRASGNQAPIQMSPLSDRGHLMNNQMIAQRHSMTNNPASSISYQVPVQMIPISNQDALTVQSGSNKVNGQTYSGINQAPAQISNQMAEELVRNQMFRQQISDQLFNQQILNQMSTQQDQSQTSRQKMFKEAAGQTSYMNNQGSPQVSGQVPPQMLSQNTPGQMPHFIDQPSEQVTYQTSSGINQMPTQRATHIHDIPGQHSTINNPVPVYSDINQMGGQMNMWSDQAPTQAMTGQIQDQAYLEMNLQPNQAYSDTNQAYPDTNQAYPDTNQASPNTNQASPNTNQAYSDTNLGYPNTNQAYPDTNQASPNTNQVSPNTNQAYSDTNLGYPNTNQAYPDTNQASSNTNQASQNQNQGYPDTNQASSNTNQASQNQNQGYSDTNQPYPNTNQDYPTTNQASPNTNQGHQNTNQGYPNTNQAYPNTNQAFQNLNQGYLNTNQASPNTNQGRPNTNQGHPNTNQASPNTNQGRPNTNQGRPKSNQGYPNTNQASPNTNQGYPNTNQASPNTNQGRPNTNQGYPNTNQASPDTNQGRSNTNQGYPNTNQASPNTIQGHPNTNQASPNTNQGPNQGYPNTNQASPNTNQGRPNTNQGYPNTNQASPNTNQGHPNTNQGHSDPNQGYPNTNQGYPNTNQGYPNTNQGNSVPNQASPNTNQGHPNTNQGYPNTNQGYSDPDQAYPDTNQGYPNMNQASPNTNQGYSNTNPGYMDPNQGYPNTNQGYPNMNQGHSDPNQAYLDTNQALLEATVRQLAGQTPSQNNIQGANQMSSMRSVQNSLNPLSSQSPESHASDPGYTTEIRLVRVPISQLTQRGQTNQNPQGASLPRNNNDQMTQNGQNPNYMVRVKPQIVNAASSGRSSSQPAIQEQPQSSHVVLTREQYIALQQAVTGNNNMGTTQNRGYA